MTNPAADDPPTTINVKASAGAVVVPETFKIAVAAGLAVLADRTMHSETAIVAVLAASGVIAVYAYSVWHRLRSWRALKFLATLVPDEIAKVR